MQQKMNLQTYKWPEVTQADLAFPTFNTPKELVDEAESRNLEKGRKAFSKLFYSGGKIILKPDVEGTWKENMWKYCLVMMNSWAPKHEHKEAVCAMIFEECLILD